jgi:trigger factor
MTTPRSMEFSVEVEKPSSVLRKLTIKVPAKVVKNYMDKGLIAIQKTAKLKGFRPGQAPISIIKQYYGEDVRHRVFHNLIDESFEEAVREHDIRTVGSPKIDTPDHKTGEGAHDHSLTEDQDLTYVATVEVMPELKVKSYTGISVDQETVEITDDQVEKVVENFVNSQAQLVPASSGLSNADGSESSRPIKNGDFADVEILGGIVTEKGVESRDDMKGSRVVEIGANSWLPGFEEQLVGLRRGENKTFRITFPEGFAQAEMIGKEAEFTVTVKEVKEKKLPTLDDEFAKQMGYESMTDFRTKAHEFLTKERTDESQRKVRSDLLAKIIEKNPFDVPTTLIEGQASALAQDWAQELKKQGFDEKMIQDAITHELENLKKRAESQVRASLILEAIAKEESIALEPNEVETEIDRLSVVMEVERGKLKEYYAKNPGRMGDLVFRLRQERTLKFLLDKSKIKSVPAAKEK